MTTATLSVTMVLMMLYMLKECSSDCANGVHDVSAAAALGASVALVVMSEAAQLVHWSRSS